MQSPRKLLLHIGSHKTGSTTLQRTLYANRSHWSNRVGAYSALHRMGKSIAAGNANAWINDRVAGGTIREGLAQQLGRVTGDVVVSSEGFSWLFTQQAVGKLGAGLSRLFSRVHIVVYIKRQDLMALSHYQQASKNKPAQRFYVPGNRGLPLYQEQLPGAVELSPATFPLGRGLRGAIPVDQDFRPRRR